MTDSQDPQPITSEVTLDPDALLHFYLAAFCDGIVNTVFGLARTDLAGGPWIGSDVATQVTAILTEEAATHPEEAHKRIAVVLEGVRGDE